MSMKLQDLSLLYNIVGEYVKASRTFAESVNKLVDLQTANAVDTRRVIERLENDVDRVLSEQHAVCEDLREIFQTLRELYICDSCKKPAVYKIEYGKEEKAILYKCPDCFKLLTASEIVHIANLTF